MINLNGTLAVTGVCTVPMRHDGLSGRLSYAGIVNINDSVLAVTIVLLTVLSKQ